LVGLTAYSFIQPDFGTAPVCMCPTHGQLAVTKDEIRNAVSRSRDLQRGVGRTSEQQKVTQRVKLHPLE
jgi:hypothetical protein